ncbi:MAG: hypothetical protein D9V47_13360 [Clostridia bacterium]|nr:MAG: hypothetical protein D9V47_13360 [Clostridia bacterium]
MGKFDRTDIDIEKIWHNPSDYQRINRRMLYEAREWFAQHAEELWEEYKGKVVAVRKGEVLAVGDDTIKMKAEFREKEPEDSVMIMLIPSDPIRRIPRPIDVLKGAS